MSVFVSKTVLCGATCPDCYGTGYDFSDGGQCDRCNGEGTISSSEDR